MSKLRAFLVQVIGSPEFDGIVFSTSASKARYVSFRAADDAGYKYSFKDLRVTRKYSLDHLYSNVIEPNRSISVDFYKI